MRDTKLRLSAMTMKSIVFSVITLYGLVETCGLFGLMCFLHLQEIGAFGPDDGGSTSLRFVRKNLPDYGRHCKTVSSMPILNTVIQTFFLCLQSLYLDSLRTILIASFVCRIINNN